jgi:PIN domain nuclease of toxin-antitoxin system
VLLDTHAFLWWIEGTPELGRRAKAAVANPDNEVLFSLASCWELAIEHSLGKLRVPRSLDRFIPEQLTLNGFALLGVELRHVLRVANLPFHHRDPFDRLLATQALKSSSLSCPPTACFASTV